MGWLVDGIQSSGEKGVMVMSDPFFWEKCYAHCLYVGKEYWLSDAQPWKLPESKDDDDHRQTLGSKIPVYLEHSRTIKHLQDF